MLTRHIRHGGLLIVLCMLFAWYTYLITGDKFSLFVHPRLHVFTYIMISCILIILVYMTFLIGEKKSIFRYSIKGTASLLFLMVALIPALGSHLDPSIIPIADMSTTRSSVHTKTSPSPETILSEANSDMGMYQDVAFVIKKVERDSEGNIILSHNDYSTTITELYMHTNDYIGEHIKGYGIVYNSKDHTEQQFGVGLYQMTCCAADTQIVGLTYTTDSSVPIVGQWVEVEGVVELDDEGQPLIVTKNILPIPSIDDPYVY